MMIRVIATIVEGVFWAMLPVIVLILLFPVQPSTDFARRWDGSCRGWTQQLAIVHVVGDLVLWTAYVVIAIVIARLHPILVRVNSAKITVKLITMIFVSCGGVHLWDAYAVFNPTYYALGGFKTFAGIIGLVGSVMVAHNLVWAFDFVAKEKSRLVELEKLAAVPKKN